MNYLNFTYDKLNEFANENKDKYLKSEPFPHIVIDNFFNHKILDEIINEFPKNLKEIGNKFDNKVERKLSLNSSNLLSNQTNDFLNFLNSQIFINFLQKLTDVEEKLIPDPYLIGGGLHELKNNGYLNVHADFNNHPTMKLDRRLNVLIYLNKNWSDSYEGNLELWDKEMISCFKEIKPIFNKCVIFNTDPESYHGHPEPLRAPISKTRKSIALYYYTASKSIYDEIPRVTTQFQARNNAEKKVLDSRKKFSLSKIITNEILPPFLVKKTRKGLFYFKEYIKGRKK